MADRVFLILSAASASMIEEILRSRIVTLDENLSEHPDYVPMQVERARLANAVGQLMAPL
jgi:hypothetical protein